MRCIRIMMFMRTVGLPVASFTPPWLLATPGWDNTRAYEGTETRAGGMLASPALIILLSSWPQSFKRLGRRPFFSDTFGNISLIMVHVMMVNVDQHAMTLYHGGLAL